MCKIYNLVKELKKEYRPSGLWFDENDKRWYLGGINVSSNIAKELYISKLLSYIDTKYSNYELDYNSEEKVKEIYILLPGCSDTMTLMGQGNDLLEALSNVCINIQNSKKTSETA